MRRQTGTVRSTHDIASGPVSGHLGAMHDAIAERRRLRAALLVRLYHEVDGSVTRFVPGYELAEAVGLDRAEAEKAIAYLEEKTLLKVDDHRAGILRLTAAGVDEAERRILESER